MKNHLRQNLLTEIWIKKPELGRLLLAFAIQTVVKDLLLIWVKLLTLSQFPYIDFMKGMRGKMVHGTDKNEKLTQTIRQSME